MKDIQTIISATLRGLWDILPGSIFIHYIVGFLKCRKGHDLSRKHISMFFRQIVTVHTCSRCNSKFQITSYYDPSTQKITEISKKRIG